MVVGIACSRIDEEVHGREALEKVRKLVSNLYVERRLGLSDMRPRELARVINHIRDRISKA